MPVDKKDKELKGDEEEYEEKPLPELFIPLILDILFKLDKDDMLLVLPKNSIYSNFFVIKFIIIS
ncbi:hypothetical protein EBS40_02190 [bacterium]|nr:hypothetical protein [bacterium]